MELEIIKRKDIAMLRQIGLRPILEAQAKITAKQILALVAQHLEQMAFLLDDKERRQYEGKIRNT